MIDSVFWVWRPHLCSETCRWKCDLDNFLWPIFQTKSLFLKVEAFLGTLNQRSTCFLHFSNRSVFVNEDEANIRFALFANSRWYRLIAKWKSLRKLLLLKSLQITTSINHNMQKLSKLSFLWDLKNWLIFAPTAIEL